MTRQSGPPSHVTEITKSGAGLTGAKWGAISGPHGATSGLVERSKYTPELLSSHNEPYRPTPEPSFASRESWGKRQMRTLRFVDLMLDSRNGVTGRFIAR